MSDTDKKSYVTTDEEMRRIWAMAAARWGAGDIALQAALTQAACAHDQFFGKLAEEGGEILLRENREVTIRAFMSPSGLKVQYDSSE